MGGFDSRRPAMAIVSLDTETFLIRPGMGAPPLVCVQYCVDRGDAQIVHATDPALPGLIEGVLRSDRINGHNVAFDMGVLAAWRPSLLPLIFAAYDDDRIVCTKIREQ